MKTKRSKACDISQKTRQEVYQRDGRCIFCRMKYHMDETTPYGRSMCQVMHYIARSHGGLGVEQNLALGCIDHHQMMDNGKHGPEMRKLMKGYLQEIYRRNWNEKSLVYRKGQ